VVIVVIARPSWRPALPTNLANVARTTVDHALREINEHVTLSGSGLCRICRIGGPCTRRAVAERTLRSYNFLPQRQPGATRPELIGLRRINLGAVSALDCGGLPEGRVRT
jgi:hypothetical protein